MGRAGFCSATFPVSSRGRPSPYKGTSSVGLGRTLMTSFNLNQLGKGSISKYSRILRQQGLGLQHVNLGEGDTIQPIAAGFFKNDRILGRKEEVTFLEPQEKVSRVGRRRMCLGAEGYRRHGCLAPNPAPWLPFHLQPGRASLGL